MKLIFCDRAQCALRSSPLHTWDSSKSALVQWGHYLLLVSAVGNRNQESELWRLCWLISCKHKFLKILKPTCKKCKYAEVQQDQDFCTPHVCGVAYLYWPVHITNAPMLQLYKPKLWRGEPSVALLMLGADLEVNSSCQLVSSSG